VDVSEGPLDYWVKPISAIENDVYVTERQMKTEEIVRALVTKSYRDVR